MRLDFVDAAKTGTWKVASQSLTGECEGVTFSGERRWWGGRWTVVGTTPFPMPEKLILFVSREGMEHGFWRDMRVGNPDFDFEHFVFCNTPALLRLIVGPMTMNFLGKGGPNEAISVYVRDGVIRTKGSNDERDEDAIKRHVGIHRAISADYEALLANWQKTLETASGRGATTWPLTGQVSSSAGTLLVGVTWEMPPESRDGAEWESSYHSLRTEVTAFADPSKPRWTFREVTPNQPATHVIGARRYALAGTPSLPLDRIEQLIGYTDLVHISYGSKLTVALRDLPRGRQLTSAVLLMEMLLRAQLGGATAPYR